MSNATMQNAIADLQSRVGTDTAHVVLLPPSKGTRSRKLGPIDLTELRKSFPSTDDVPDQRLMRWLASNSVAPHLNFLFSHVFLPYRPFFDTILPSKTVAGTPYDDRLDIRVAYLAKKAHQGGVAAHELETHPIHGLVVVAERIYKDSSDFFSGLAEMSMEAKFLVSARGVITALEDMDSIKSKTFTSDLIQHPVARPMASDVREAWEQKIELPNTAKARVAPTIPPNQTASTAPTAAPLQPVDSRALYIHNTQKSWSPREHLMVLQQYADIEKKCTEQGRDFDWAELSNRLPGRSENDCIQFHNAAKDLFGHEGQPDVPFNDSTPAVSRTKHLKRKWDVDEGQHEEWLRREAVALKKQRDDGEEAYEELYTAYEQSAAEKAQLQRKVAQLEDQLALRESMKADGDEDPLKRLTAKATMGDEL